MRVVVGSGHAGSHVFDLFKMLIAFRIIFVLDVGMARVSVSACVMMMIAGRAILLWRRVCACADGTMQWEIIFISMPMWLLFDVTHYVRVAAVKVWQVLRAGFFLFHHFHRANRDFPSGSIIFLVFVFHFKLLIAFSVRIFCFSIPRYTLSSWSVFIIARTFITN